MLLNLILTVLCGVAGVILFDKWQVDDFMNTHPVFYRFWPKTCLLCRAFWFGLTAYCLLLLWPASLYLLIPFAAIPLQVFLTERTR